MMVIRQQLVDEAMSCLGTPFVHNGRLKGVGLDCAGLVEMTARALGLYQGVVIPAYTMSPDPKLMRSILRGNLDEIAFKQIGLADILWFRISYDPQHLGIVVGMDPLTIIHVLNSSGRKEVVLTVVHSLWRERVAGCFRYRGVA